MVSYLCRQIVKTTPKSLGLLYIFQMPQFQERYLQDLIALITSEQSSVEPRLFEVPMPMYRVVHILPKRPSARGVIGRPEDKALLLKHGVRRDQQLLAVILVNLLRYEQMRVRRRAVGVRLGPLRRGEHVRGVQRHLHQRADDLRRGGAPHAPGVAGEQVEEQVREQRLHGPGLALARVDDRQAGVDDGLVEAADGEADGRHEGDERAVCSCEHDDLVV